MAQPPPALRASLASDSERKPAPGSPVQCAMMRIELYYLHQVNEPIIIIELIPWNQSQLMTLTSPPAAIF